jgi:hypothetical protein
MFLDRLVAYITGSVDQELLLRNEYLAAVIQMCVAGWCAIVAV